MWISSHIYTTFCNHPINLFAFFLFGVVMLMMLFMFVVLVPFSPRGICVCVWRIYVEGRKKERHTHTFDLHAKTSNAPDGIQMAEFHLSDSCEVIFLLLVLLLLLLLLLLTHAKNQSSRLHSINYHWIRMRLILLSIQAMVGSIFLLKYTFNGSLFAIFKYLFETVYHSAFSANQHRQHCLFNLHEMLARYSSVFYDFVCCFS